MLFVEDSQADAELLLAELESHGYDVMARRVETAEEMRAALVGQGWDLVLSDFSLPSFTAPAALALLKEIGIEIPFLIVSGTIDEETAVAALKAGASDFLVKGRLARLAPAIERELREVTLSRERLATQVKLEEQLRQAQKMEALGHLAGSIAHDFNNLLTAILGYCELLSDQIGPDKPIGRDLQEIKNAGERAAALTRQLLAFSRKQVLTITPVDLNGVVRGIQNMLGRLMGERIVIRTELADGLDPIMADASQMEQVLLNLAVNARDAMAEGGELLIRTSTLDAPGPDGQALVMLTVGDTGMGIAPEDQARIFEPFFTTKEHGRGTGLGLAAVQTIVSQLNGSIQVRSVVGEGTTFDVRIPATDLPVPAATGVRREALRVGTETILLVEDEPGVRSFTQLALRRVGHRVIVAETAEQALLLADVEPTPIHLLLTDLVLPRMDGRELADRLRRARPGIRVLFMSGYTELTSQELGTVPGYEILAKPFTAKDLLTKIRRQLEIPQ